MALKAPFQIQVVLHGFLLCTATFKIHQSCQLGKLASFFLLYMLPPCLFCFSKTSMALLDLVISPHLLGAFSVNKIQLGMPVGPTLQRESNNTCESFTCHVHNKALHHQLHGLKQILQKKNTHQVICAVDIVNADVSCKYEYFMMF